MLWRKRSRTGQVTLHLLGNEVMMRRVGGGCPLVGRPGRVCLRRRIGVLEQITLGLAPGQQAASDFIVA